MRTVTINLGAGQDTTIDPRIAPTGSFVRAENCRLDKQGRLVSRRGYSSLGTSVHGNPDLGFTDPGALVPHDLHNCNGELVALGNHSAGVQTGIRALYRYAPNTQGTWWTELGRGNANGFEFATMPVASNCAFLAQSITAVAADRQWNDVAISADGRFVCWVTTHLEPATDTPNTMVNVWDTVERAVTFRTVALAGRGNCRVLCLSASTFKIFHQNFSAPTEIRVQTLDMASVSPALSASSTAVATGVNAYPGPYDVCNFAGTTDYAIAWTTAAGTSWTRYTSSDVSVSGNATAGLAGAAISVQGATGESINVARQRAVSGFEHLSYNPTTGALISGPTNLDTDARVYSWVSVVRSSSTEVLIQAIAAAVSPRIVEQRIVVTATGAISSSPSDMSGARPMGKPFDVGTNKFQLIALGETAPAPVGIVMVQPLPIMLHGCLLDGLAQVVYGPDTAWALRQAVSRAGTTEFYAAVPVQDPRDKTYRSILVSFSLYSGERRQAVPNADALYIAGGNITLWDRALTAEGGFESTPVITSLAPNGSGGALTLLGAYTYQVILRVALPNGRVMQSAPSSPSSITLTGANNATIVRFTTPFGLRIYGPQSFREEQVFADIYRTEAGGSIPRLIASQLIQRTSTFGFFGQFQDNIADAAQQGGAAMYTQGADGSVSGRLPLGLPSPGRLLAENAGRLLIGGLEKDSQLHYSIEGRPGEVAGFVNDDIFFVQNPETITALVSSNGGRKLIFGRSNIRELVGDGSNAAGVGEIAEPVEICSHVGAADWRSVAKTEHGVFFGSSPTGSEDPKIYLLPEGSDGAIDVSESIRDVLQSYPVIASVTRHDDEQLLTFALQNSDATDGRLVHLDLRSSGLTNRGWIGRWFVDRVAAFESAPFPEIVAEYEWGGLSRDQGEIFNIPLPQGQQLGDRIVIWMAQQSAGPSIPSGIASYTFLGTATGGGGNDTYYERILTSAGSVGALQALVQVNSTPGLVFGKVWLIRGSHQSQAAEAALSGASGSSALLGTNTPSWGATNTLWLSTCMLDSFVSGGVTQAFRAFPDGFRGGLMKTFRNVAGTGVMCASYACCWSQQAVTSLGPGLSYSLGITTNWATRLVAIRPAGAAGSPVRATSHYQGRLVVCTANDVLRSDPTAVADQGGAFIAPLIETSDIYPMGEGGAGRHLSCVFLGELVGFCTLTLFLSYDSGYTWIACQTYNLSPRQGFAIGQTLRLTWVPKRRKIEGVRGRLVVGEQNIFTPLPGDTRAVAMNRLMFNFDELIGPVRQPAGRQQ